MRAVLEVRELREAGCRPDVDGPEVGLLALVLLERAEEDRSSRRARTRDGRRRRAPTASPGGCASRRCGSRRAPCRSPAWSATSSSACRRWCGRPGSGRRRGCRRARRSRVMIVRWVPRAGRSARAEKLLDLAELAVVCARAPGRGRRRGGRRASTTGELDVADRLRACSGRGPWRGAPPSAATVKTGRALRPLQRSKAICFPSGDQSGWSST